MSERLNRFFGIRKNEYAVKAGDHQRVRIPPIQSVVRADAIREQGSPKIRPLKKRPPPPVSRLPRADVISANWDTFCRHRQIVPRNVPAEQSGAPSEHKGGMA